MLEISPHHRLVKHVGQGENCWMVMELNAEQTCYKRAIWKPVTPLLSEDQAEHWLTSTNATAETIAQFKHASRSAN